MLNISVDIKMQGFIKALEDRNIELVMRLLRDSYIYIIENASMWQNLALLEAVKAGYFYIVRYLLQSNVVKKYVHVEDNRIFRAALLNGNLSVGRFYIVKELMNIPEIRELVSNDPSMLSAVNKLYNENIKFVNTPIEVLESHAKSTAIILEDSKMQDFLDAVRARNVDTVRIALQDPHIIQNANRYNNWALLIAVTDGSFFIVQQLLTNYLVRRDAHLFNNLILRIAVNRKFLTIVQELMKIPEVREFAFADTDLLGAVCDLGTPSTSVIYNQTPHAVLQQFGSLPQGYTPHYSRPQPLLRQLVPQPPTTTTSQRGGEQVRQGNSLMDLADYCVEDSKIKEPLNKKRRMGS